MNATKTWAGALILGLGLAAPGALTAQGQMGQQGQGMQQMQQQMARMQDMMQRMNQMQDRIHQMDQSLMQQMDQLRTRDQDQARDMARDQDRDRLMQHQQLHDMLQTTGDMVRQMTRGMEQLRRMSGQPGFGSDPAMARNMEQLQERFRNMADQMDGSLKLMEQMQERLQGQSGTGQPDNG